VIPAGNYYYCIEAVTRNGLTTATELGGAVTVAATNHVTLSWTTPNVYDPDGNLIDVFAYRIFRTAAGGASGTESLYAVVSALDASDNPVTSWVDTGAPVNPNLQGSTAIAITFNSTSGGTVAAPDGYTFPRLQANGQVLEDIFLVPRNPEFALCPVVNEMYPELLANVNGRTRQYALMSDQTFALRGPLFASKICRVRADG
jgi:hypothetical protein